MGQKLSAEDMALYRAVDEVLYYVWDPIGVSGVPQARDEYHAYLPHVFALVRDGSDANEIAQYLSRVISDRIELNMHSKHNLEVANLLLEWRTVVRELHT